MTQMHTTGGHRDVPDQTRSEWDREQALDARIGRAHQDAMRWHDAVMYLRHVASQIDDLDAMMEGYDAETVDSILTDWLPIADQMIAERIEDE